MVQGRHGGRALLAILLVGLGSARPSGHAPGAERSGPKAEGEATPTAPTPAPARRVETPGIENLFRLAPHLYSGAQPEGQPGFESLKRLGVKTIISVDGARPDVERAQRFGMRYVHLPVGYDGITREQAVRLVKAARDLPGPLFVHCHHGMHRGPTAAALCVMATAEWDRSQGRAWLEEAGTDPKYKGLYTTVDRFVMPSAQELAKVGRGDLPEHADLPSLVEAMVRIDAHWDRLKAAEKAGFRPRTGLDPAHEATMLTEQFREAARHDETKERGTEFTRLMTGAERDAEALEAAIPRANPTASDTHLQAAEAAFLRMSRSCSACHAHFRDERPGD